MAIENSLDESMNRAVKHYSSLFSLPSYWRVLSLLAVCCVSGGLISTMPLFPLYDGLIIGLFLGLSLFVTNVIFDYLISTVVLDHDYIYDMRRTAALSLFCWILWDVLIFVGATATIPFDSSFVIKLSLLGFATVLILRLVVLNSTSARSSVRLFSASTLQPFPCMIPLLILWEMSNLASTSTLSFMLLSLVVGHFSGLLFTILLNRVGKQKLGVPSLTLFKAFMLNWIVGLNAPLEEHLEKLGTDQDVEATIVSFATLNRRAVMVTPSIHPGPFKNIGSSLLPSILKAALERKYKCVACVPHGLLGHELDLASQIHNHRVIDHIVESVNLHETNENATPLVRISDGLATARCQIFGNFLFISITLAPHTTEDLPQELGLFVLKKSKEMKIACCAIVNAHNSINEVAPPKDTLDAMKTVAANCMAKAHSMTRSAFKVGVASIKPPVFTVKSGMGHGGITTIVIKVGEQVTAYVVIDGNNMVSGLREKIILALVSMGIDESEVFTTDTHSVNALVLNERGYHPIGEVLDQEKLIDYIKKTAASAMAELEPAKASCSTVVIPDVRVIGGKKLEAMCLLVDRTLQRAKKIAVPIFGIAGFVLMLFLMWM